MKIFVSYRREDTSYIAGRLHDRLEAHFGPDRVFRDVETLAPGVDFGDRIEAAMRSCDALVAVIGDGWLGDEGTPGHRRLDRPDDWVRLEIAAALERGILVVPVLVEDAEMPSADQLPESIRTLARRNAMELTDLRWDYDVQRLIDALDRSTPAGPSLHGAGPPAPAPSAPPLHRLGQTVPLPPLLCRPEAVPLVGRDAELVQLQAALDGAGAGDQRAVMVGGEPGIGKTRLAAETARAAHAGGTVILAGRCDEDLGVPYQPFVEALRHLADHSGDGDLSARLGRYGGELARLVPELSQRGLGLSPPLSSDPETERYRLFDAVAAWLGATSSADPVLLVLDDLQWATKPTVLLLRHVLRSPEPMRVLVLGTYRQTEVEGTPMAELLADLRRQPGVEQLVLEGLDQTAVSDLVAAVAGPDVDTGEPELAPAIHDQTGGNPFFVGEVVRHLAETRPLDGGRWTATSLPELGVPEGVRAVVGQRLSLLSEATTRLLETASVIGLEFEVRLLRAASGDDDDAVVSALEEAAGARLVEDVPGRGLRQRFLHALLRATLYDGISKARRAQLHRRVGEAIESIHAAKLDEHLPELARHYAAAVDGESAKAATYLQRAGDRSLALLANHEAAGFFGQALDFVDLAGLDDRAADIRRCELMISLGEAQRRSGEGDYRQTLLDAAALARRLDDPVRLAEAALANNRGFFSSAGRVDQERVRVLGEALEAYPQGDSAVRARLLTHLAVELIFAGDWDARVSLSDEAVAMARRVADVETLVHVLDLRFVTLWGASTMAHRLAIATEARRLAAGLDNSTPGFYATVFGANAALEAGDIDGADRLLEASSHLAQGLGQPVLKWYWSVTKVKRELVGGSLAECERLSMEAFSIGQEAGQDDAVLWFGFQFSIVRIHQDRASEVVGLAESGPQTGSFTGSVPLLSRAALAVIYCELEREADARRTYEALMAQDLRDLPLDFGWLGVVAMCAQVCAFLHDRRHAEPLHRMLERYREQFVDAGPGWLGSTARYLGLTAATLGRTDEAIAHFSYAADAHARIRSPVWLARVHLDWGTALLDAGDPAHAEDARGLLQRALTAATQLGLPRIGRQASALLAAHP